MPSSETLPERHRRPFSPIATKLIAVATNNLALVKSDTAHTAGAGIGISLIVARPAVNGSGVVKIELTVRSSCGRDRPNYGFFLWRDDLCMVIGREAAAYGTLVKL